MSLASCCLGINYQVVPRCSILVTFPNRVSHSFVSYPLIDERLNSEVHVFPSSPVVRLLNVGLKDWTKSFLDVQYQSSYSQESERILLYLRSEVMPEDSSLTERRSILDNIQVQIVLSKLFQVFYPCRRTIVRKNWSLSIRHYSSVYTGKRIVISV